MDEFPDESPSLPEPTGGGLDVGALRPWHLLLLLGLLVVIGGIVLTIVLVANASRKPRYHYQPQMHPSPGPQQWQGGPPPGAPQQLPYPPGTQTPPSPPGAPPPGSPPA
ncbi:hypothetical protein AB0K52_13355 [Glycomyces sp. NPDC049804]|uniref:hypothetical protein n=1 Tax=Glycomyces sp. NPDC049804 TaxID=3154363 RepID=UPI0034409688